MSSAHIASLGVALTRFSPLRAQVKSARMESDRFKRRPPPPGRTTRSKGALERGARQP